MPVVQLEDVRDLYGFVAVAVRRVAPAADLHEREELVQVGVAICVEMARQWSDRGGHGSFAAYARRYLDGRLIDVRRRERRHQGPAVDFEPGGVVDEYFSGRGDLWLRVYHAENAQAAASQYPTTHAEVRAARAANVFTMSMDGFDQAEIARACGVSVRTVKSVTADLRRLAPDGRLPEMVPSAIATATRLVA